MIPNIKKLHVTYCDYDEGFDEGVCTLNDVHLLQKLESFTCRIHAFEEPYKYNMLRNLTFPHSLKKLCLANLHWDDVTAKIGWLPQLEVLKLRWCCGHEWELVEGQFAKLQILKIHGRYLKADNYHFPSLCHLVLKHMRNFEVISSGIGDIPTLKSIKLLFCDDPAVISAREIAVEQYDNGNYDLQVSATLSCWGQSNLSESFNTYNFHIN